MPPLPPPLPPEERPVGQLVAEAIRLYGRRPFASVALGVGPALVNALARANGEWSLVVIPFAAGLAVSTSLVGACLLADARRQRPLAALAAGALVFIPVPFLAVLFILPALVWLGLVGLVVPVLVYEGGGLRDAFVRAFRLAWADYVHVLGALATLAIIVFLTQSVLFFLLRGTGDQTLTAASFIASLVVTPLLFLGVALLYFDQVARQDRSRVPRR
jgi:hypothetical protein